MEILVDASAILKCYFPDEEGHKEAQGMIQDYAKGIVDFVAPTLITYEVSNACLIAFRKKRITREKARELIYVISQLEITKEPIESLVDEILDVSIKFERTFYDGAYVALAKSRGLRLVTGDRKLYNATKRSFPWVVWIEAYSAIQNR